MSQIVITESLAPVDRYAVLMDALAAELQRQLPVAPRDGERITVIGEVDLRGLVFAALQALSATAA